MLSKDVSPAYNVFSSCCLSSFFFDIFNHLFQGRITLKCHLVFMFPFMIKNPPATLACFIISGCILWLHLLWLLRSLTFDFFFLLSIKCRRHVATVDIFHHRQHANSYRYTLLQLVRAELGTFDPLTCSSHIEDCILCIRVFRAYLAVNDLKPPHTEWCLNITWIRISHAIPYFD